MKALIILLFVIGCTSKYQTFHTIKKGEFQYKQGNSPIGHNPIAPKLYPGRKVTQNSCHNQWLFSSNAMQKAYNDIPALVNYSCPGENYLVNSKITESWWTTLFFSRGCVELETHCPRKR